MAAEGVLEVIEEGGGDVGGLGEEAEGEADDERELEEEEDAGEDSEENERENGRLLPEQERHATRTCSGGPVLEPRTDVDARGAEASHDEPAKQYEDDPGGQGLANRVEVGEERAVFLVAEDGLLNGGGVAGG